MDRGSLRNVIRHVTPHIIEFGVKGDERGQLIAIEELTGVPFNIQRIYYIYGTQPGVRRGRHAHHKTVQVAICIRGSCRVYLDDGASATDVLLERPDRGLLLESLVWHDLYDFSDDAIVLVLADQLYDESDYIRSYDVFVAVAQ